MNLTRIGLKRTRFWGLCVIQLNLRQVQLNLRLDGRSCPRSGGVRGARATDRFGCRFGFDLSHSCSIRVCLDAFTVRS
jgi:hypothetical protein